MLQIILVSLLISVEPQVLTGQVVSIADGDTLTIHIDKQQHRIRLHGIDAPERKQAYSQKAKEHLAGFVAEQTIRVTVVDRDRYGRLIGTIETADGTNVNRELVKAGFAWWYRL